MALNLEVNILGEYKNLSKATRGATKQLQGLQTTAKRISRSINGAFAAIGIGISFGALKSGIQSVVAEASNLEQAYGATAAVFKNSSQTIIDSSKRAATAYGLSANQYLQSANLIGAQLSNLGFTQEEYTKQTEGLVGLGADLAATFGGTAYDAVQALSAVFRGEYNQVEKYGVSIRKSDINARVAAKGYKGATGELLKQQEALAALEILYGQTESAQGQFARESNTLAGATQILQAGLANAKTEIGEGFYPAIYAVADFINSNMDVWTNLADAIGTKIKEAFEGSGDAATTFGGKIVTTLTDLTSFLNGTAESGNVFATLAAQIGPILDLLGAFGELAKGVMAVIDGLVDSLFGWIPALFGASEGTLGFADLIRFLGGILQKAGEFLGFIISLFIPFTAGFKLIGIIVKNITKPFQILGQFIKTVTDGFLNFISIFKRVEAPLDKAVRGSNYVAGAIRSGVGAGNNANGTKGSTTVPKLYSGPMIDPKTGKSLIPKSTLTIPKASPLNLPTTPGGTKTKSKAEIAAEKALEKFKKNVQNLVDTVEEALKDAKARVKNASENFRDNVQLSFGIITNGAFAVFDVNRVIRQMQKIKDAAKTFADDIKALQAGGADQALIDQLLGMDPISGSVAARGLLSSGRLQEFLDLRKELAGIGGAAGEAANVGIYGTSTSNLETTLSKLNRLLEGGVSNVYNINVNNANNMSATDIINAIKKYEKTSGKKVFSN